MATHSTAEPIINAFANETASQLWMRGSEALVLRPGSATGRPAESLAPQCSHDGSDRDAELARSEAERLPTPPGGDAGQPGYEPPDPRSH